MYYLLWIFGVAVTILFTALLMMNIEKTGKFDQ